MTWGSDDMVLARLPGTRPRRRRDLRHILKAHRKRNPERLIWRTAVGAHIRLRCSVQRFEQNTYHGDALPTELTGMLYLVRERDRTREGIGRRRQRDGGKGLSRTGAVLSVDRAKPLGHVLPHRDEHPKPRAGLFVSRRVCWRCGRSRAPPTSSGSVCSSRASNDAGGRSLTRAAASSTAKGRPSSLRAIFATGLC
jgi:hypothetical protein